MTAAARGSRTGPFATPGDRLATTVPARPLRTVSRTR